MTLIDVKRRTSSLLEAFRGMVARHRGEVHPRKLEARDVDPRVGVSRSVTSLPTRDANEANYFLPLPHQKVLKLLRGAVKQEGWRIPMEMDVARRIHNELGIGLKPCTVLCVDCPFVLLQAAVWSGLGTSVLPIQVVVSQSGTGTAIRFAKHVDAGLPAWLRIPFERFLERLTEVLKQIGARHV